MTRLRSATFYCVVLAAVPLISLALLGFEPTIAKWRDDKAKQRCGMVPRTLFREDGRRRPYLVFVPHVPPDAKNGLYPVIMSLNGAGEEGDDGFMQIYNNFGRPTWELKRSFPFLYVMPQSREGGSWAADSPDTMIALETLDQVLKDYPADPDRVYVTGASKGGTGAFELGAAFPDRFAAIVPLSAGGSSHLAERCADKLATAKMPVWSFFISGDKPNVVDFNREIRRHLLSAGQSPLFTEYDRGGHDTWNFAMRDPAVYAWLLRQSKSCRAQDLTFLENTIDSNLTKWQSTGAGNWVAKESVIDFIPAESDDVNGMSYLQLDDSLHNFDLHFDYRSKQSAHLELRLSPETKVEDDWQYQVIILSPNLGSGGIVDQLSGKWIASSDPGAQLALQSGFWNQVHMSLFSGHLVVQVNGWKLIDINDSRLEKNGVNIGLVGSKSLGEQQRWRDVRIRRKLASGAQE